MKRVLVICLLLALIFVFACAHRRPSISYFKPGMTKTDVIREWDETPIQTFMTVKDITLEMWEYQFTKWDYIRKFHTQRAYFVFQDDKIIYTQLDTPPDPVQIRGYVNVHVDNY